MINHKEKVYLLGAKDEADADVFASQQAMRRSDRRRSEGERNVNICPTGRQPDKLPLFSAIRLRPPPLAAPAPLCRILLELCPLFLALVLRPSLNRLSGKLTFAATTAESKVGEGKRAGANRARGELKEE